MRKLRYANLLLAAVSILIAVFVVELGSRLILDRYYVTVDKMNWQVLNIPDPVLGYRARPNSSGMDEGYRKGALQYRVTYTTNEFGRRIVPGADPATRKHFIAIFGCSYSFGLAVNDDETVAAWLARLAPDYMPYNFAYSGYGTQHVFMTMQEPIEREIKQKTGIGIYVFMDGHTNRLMGAPVALAGWGMNFPCLAEENGSIKYLGSFAKVRPRWVKLCNLLSKSGTVGLLQRILSRNVAYGVDFTARVIAEARDEFQRKFPGSEFYVAFHYSTVDPRAYDALIPSLEKHHIKVLRCDKMRDPHLPLDSLWVGRHHPSSKGHEMMARCLVEQLHLSDSPPAAEPSVKP